MRNLGYAFELVKRPRKKTFRSAARSTACLYDTRRPEVFCTVMVTVNVSVT